MSAAIEVVNLRREFRVPSALLAPPRHVIAVDDVTFSVPAGSVLGIVGESGCGKSTLARLILGLLAPTSGAALVDGKRLFDLDRKARARLIQPVFQDPFASLNPRRRIKDIVALPLTAQGTFARAEVERRVAQVLDRVGLSVEMGERMPSQLSGGQRQRAAIARALVLEPRIVICDEPTSALDVSVQAQILNLLADLRRDLGLTYIFISHNLAVVEHVASEVAVMYLGRIVERNETDALFRVAPPPLHAGAAGQRAHARTGAGRAGCRPRRHHARSRQYPARLPLPPALPYRGRALPWRTAAAHGPAAAGNGRVPPGRRCRLKEGKMRVQSRLGMAILAAALLGGGAVPVAAQKSADTLRITMRDALTNIDPYYNNLRTGVVMHHQAWDALVYRNPDTFKLEPLLATEWKMPDATTIDFTLRPGVKFHDGSPFTADDVVYTVNLVADPMSKVSTPSNYTWLEKAEKTGDLSVRVKLKRPIRRHLSISHSCFRSIPRPIARRLAPKPM